MIRWWLSGIVSLAVLATIIIPRPDLYGGASFSTLITDRDDRPLQLTLADDDRYRLFVPLGDMAKVVPRITLLYEDRWFYYHPGFNPVALLRGAWTTWVQRSRPVGGSTISMQLARLRFGLDTRTPLGKLVQIARAVQLERHYHKDEILEAYLNLAPYGGSVEGIGTASWIFFGKSASELSLTEAATLAVVPQNPSVRNPARLAGREKLGESRRRLMTQWLSHYPMDHPALANLSSPMDFRPAAELPFRAPHFVRDHVPGSAQGVLTPTVLKTTLDLQLQTLLEERIASHLGNRPTAGLDNASAILVDSRSMDILALVGSADFFNVDIQGQVNGVLANRSPGSTLKPLLYGLALDRGLIHPMTLMKDAPRRYAAYTPENFDRGFMGPVSARDALIHSRNVPAVHLLARLGVDNFHNWLESAGLDGLRGPEEHGLALALGGSEASMEELVRLYAVLANGGEWRELNTTLPRTGTVRPARQLLSREASFLVLDILKDVPRPDTPDFALAEQSTVAWKTGTSFGYRDAWSIGIVGPYVLAVWVGNFDGSSNPHLVGREAAAPLFFSIVDSLGITPGSFHPDPSLNLRKVSVCARTGDLPGRHCPSTGLSWFIPGVSPINVSTVHRPVAIDVSTGLRSCQRDNATVREEVYEFWPSDIAAVFKRAGIAMRRPPAWAPECELTITSSFGHAPRIASPLSTLVYQAPHASKEYPLLFSAVTDADTRELFWFVDNHFVARVNRDEPFFWKPRPGKYTVRVVDDLGRAASVPMLVEQSG